MTFKQTGTFWQVIAAVAKEAAKHLHVAASTLHEDGQVTAYAIWDGSKSTLTVKVNP